MSIPGKTEVLRAVLPLDLTRAVGSRFGPSPNPSDARISIRTFRSSIWAELSHESIYRRSQDTRHKEVFPALALLFSFQATLIWWVQI